jgi:hypothetical protein
LERAQNGTGSGTLAPSQLTQRGKGGEGAKSAGNVPVSVRCDSEFVDHPVNSILDQNLAEIDHQAEAIFLAT